MTTLSPNLVKSTATSLPDVVSAQSFGAGGISEFHGGTFSWLSAGIGTFVSAHWSASEYKFWACGDAISERPLLSVAVQGLTQAKVYSHRDQSSGKDSLHLRRRCCRSRGPRKLQFITVHVKLAPAARIHLYPGKNAQCAWVPADPSVGVGKRSIGRRNPTLAHW
jgi:hypothetical protein